MSFSQPDGENTFSEIVTTLLGDIHYGAAAIGLISLVVLVIWNRSEKLKNFIIPGPLVVVVGGVLLYEWFLRLGGPWAIGSTHLVQIPVAESYGDLTKLFLRFPDFSQWNNPAIYTGAVTIALVASLETLLNVEAVDKLDTFKRVTPRNRELVAQGAGNIVSGLIGGLPMTSVIIRSAVNVNAGARTKVSAIFHGLLLVSSVIFFPSYLNKIPLAALAAILLVTGFKLASPQLFRQMWKEGRYQFLPFLITLLAIIFTDLLIGVLIGLMVSALFILNSNLRQPIRQIVEKHLDGDILHVELANQVSFLNRASIDKLFNTAQPGTHMLIDATATDYIDPDLLGLIRDYKENAAPARDVSVSLRGFRSKYALHDDIQFADYTTRELQDRATPKQILEVLREGNRRFQNGKRLTRNFTQQVNATAAGQSPLAVVLSCIDSRVPVELIFDLGIGDVFSVRVAGNVVGTKSLGSMEYGIAAAGVKLLIVLGHTRCSAVTSSVQLISKNKNAQEAYHCDHLDSIVNEVKHSVEYDETQDWIGMSEEEGESFIDEVAKRNVHRTMHEIIERSTTIREAVESGRAMVVGGFYDVKTGKTEFFLDEE